MDKRSTTDKVVQALEALKRAGKPVTLSGVAKRAGIERKTIYNHPELLLKVKQAAESRNVANPAPEPKSSRGKSVGEDRIARYRNDIRRLEDEKAKLLYQNKLLMEDILAMQTRLSELEEAVRLRAEPVARMSLSKRLRKNK